MAVAPHTVTIVTCHYRPKRAPRKKRKQPALASVIVIPAPMKKRLGPVIRLGAEAPSKSARLGNLPAPAEPTPKRSAIAETRRPADATLDLTPKEVRRRADAADALFREIVRRVTSKRE